MAARVSASASPPSTNRLPYKTCVSKIKQTREGRRMRRAAGTPKKVHPVAPRFRGWGGPASLPQETVHEKSDPWQRGRMNPPQKQKLRMCLPEQRNVSVKAVRQAQSASPPSTPGSPKITTKFFHIKGEIMANFFPNLSSPIYKNNPCPS